MRVLKFMIAAALMCCAGWLVFGDMEWINDTPSVPDGAVGPSSEILRYIPMAEDTIRCDDGTDYYIVGAYGYPDCGPLPSAPQEWFQDELSEGEAIRYKDGSGDYLFMQNVYETLRMAYTVCGGKDGISPKRIRLTVPEDIPSDGFSPWDPERVTTLADAGPDGTVCVEAWDMFKDGVYYKTVYEIGVDRREAGA